MKKILTNNKLLTIFLMFLFGNLSSATLTFMISWTVLKQTHQASQFALISTISSVVMLVTMPLVGIIVDKYNHKKLLLVAQCFSIFVLLIFIIQPFQNLLAYILFSVGLDLGDLLFSITMYASVKSLSEEKQEMSQINGIEQGVGALFAIISPGLAGVFLTFITVKSFSWLEIFCEAVVILMVLRLNFKEKKTVRKKTDKEDEKSSYKTVFKLLKKKSALLIIVGILIALNFLLGSINVGIPFMLNHRFHGNTIILGIVQLTFPAGIIVGSFLTQKLQKYFIFKVLKISYFSCAFVILGFGIVLALMLKNMIVIVACLALLMLLIGLSLGISRVPMMTFAQNNIPEEIQGRAFTIIDTSAQILAPVGLMFYGLLFDHFQGQWIYLISGVLMILAITIGFRFVDKVDKEDYVF
ncbi:MFS transporter [Lactococcus nasutitermitis]|uniref:MFS transporter n=1 Tax=Lactococcus nasutitermitis TaxID=1652957 RepID=A0ABV9JGQ8_9LACT|nr:MFS transporter [Lactococcus nasutitermitis]